MLPIYQIIHFSNTSNLQHLNALNVEKTNILYKIYISKNTLQTKKKLRANFARGRSLLGTLNTWRNQHRDKISYVPKELQ